MNKSILFAILFISLAFFSNEVQEVVACHTDVIRVKIFREVILDDADNNTNVEKDPNETVK